MYSVALSAAIAVAVSSRSPLEFLKGCVRFGGRPQVVLYLLSPLVTFASLGLFLLLVSPFATLKGLTPIDAAKLLALSYVASVTVNALFALGEEIGWRGASPELPGGGAGLQGGYPDDRCRLGPVARSSDTCAGLLRPLQVGGRHRGLRSLGYLPSASPRGHI